MRGSYAFWTLATLIVVTCLFGGSSRADLPSLVILRPIAAIALGVGLFALTWENVRRYRWLLIGMGAIVLLTILQLIPLPPSIWTALPGREIAVEAGAAGGIAQPWRPIAMVPWRAWNVLFALMVPAAAILLAIRCTADERRRLVPVFLIMVLLSVLLASAQVASGYNQLLYFYRTSSPVPVGLFANRNHFAVMLSCALPLLVIAALRNRDVPPGALRMWLAGVLVMTGLLLLLLTGSRSGLFVAIVAMAAMPLLFRRDRTRRTSARGRRMLVAGTGLLAVMLLVVGAIYFARAESIDRLFATNGAEELRFRAWAPIWDMVLSYFPVGAGAGSFVEVFYAAEPRELLKPSYLNHAHNDWLEWLLDFGLAGAVLALAAVVAWGRRSFRLLRMPLDGAGGADLGIAGAVIILLLGVASIVDYPVRVPSIACLAAIAAVWMAAARGEGRAAAAEEHLRGRDAPAPATNRQV